MSALTRVRTPMNAFIRTGDLVWRKMRSRGTSHCRREATTVRRTEEPAIKSPVHMLYNFHMRRAPDGS